MDASSGIVMHDTINNRRRSALKRCNTALDHPITSASLLPDPQMNRLWQILAFLLLALMVPASACCLGSQQVINDECGCCSNAGKDQNSPAQPETCPSDTIARSQLPEDFIMPEMQMIELADLVQAMMRLKVPW